MAANHASRRPCSSCARTGATVFLVVSLALSLTCGSLFTLLRENVLETRIYAATLERTIRDNNNKKTWLINIAFRRRITPSSTRRGESMAWRYAAEDEVTGRALHARGLA